MAPEACLAGGMKPQRLTRQRSDLRLINLECAVTARGRPAAKGIHYRLHPGNLPLLDAAAIDGCVLANNHVQDWGPDGLRDTLTHREHRALRQLGLHRPRRTTALRPPPDRRGRR